MMDSFCRLHGSSRLLVLLLVIQLLVPLPGLAQAVPAPVNGAPAQPAASTAVAPSPIALDLASTARSLTAPNLLGSGAANIMVNGVARSVTAQTMITPAERLAVYQVLSTGAQSLLLGAGGNAVGGRFLIGPNFSQYVSSLVVPPGVTAVNLLTSSSTFNLKGNLINAGNLFVASSNPAFSAANISATNINNLQGALLSSVLPAAGIPGVTSAVPHLSLNLSAINDFINAGTIKSAGNLSISAGGSIVNSLPSGATGPAPVMQANNDLSLVSGAGRIVNSGVITSLLGNINIASQMAQNIRVENAAGALNAANGAISVGAPLAAEQADISIQGGDLTAKTLHFYGRDMNVSVDRLNGTLNMTGSTARVTAFTPDMVLGDIALSGDPTFYNTGGAVTIASSLSYSGQNLAIVAASNIVSATGAGSIDTSSSTTSGGAITLIAGASFTTSGSSGQQGPDSTSTLTITGGSITGGYIDLTGGIGSGTPGATPIRALTSKSSAINGNGGNITLAAFAGTNTNAGAIVLPAAVPITSGGYGTGANGNVLVLAGRTSGTAISTGSIVTTGGASGTGSITVKNATPIASLGMTVTNGAVTGAFNAGGAQSGSVSTGALTAAGADVRLLGGSYSASGSIAGGNVQMTSASAIRVTGTITGSTSASLQAADSLLASSLSGISAPTVSVTSTSGSIGASGVYNALKISATNLTANAGADNQNVYISATAIGTAPARVNLTGSNSAGAANGSFNLTSTGGINLAGGASVAAGGSVVLAASGIGGSISQADANGATTIFSPAVTLTAGYANAGIGSTNPSNPIGIAASRADVTPQTVVVNANAPGGSVVLNGKNSLHPADVINVNLTGASSAGPGTNTFSLTTTGGILMLSGAKVTGSTGTIALTAGAGQSITQAGTGTTLSAGTINLSADTAGAAGTVGTQEKSLTVSSAGLSATAGSHIWVNNLTPMSAFSAASRSGNVMVNDTGGVTFSGLSSSPSTFSLTANGAVTLATGAHVSASTATLTANGAVTFGTGAYVSASTAVNLQSGTNGRFAQTDAQTVNTIIAPSVTLGAGTGGIGSTGHAVGIASQVSGNLVSLSLTSGGAAYVSGNFPAGGNGSSAAGFTLNNPICTSTLELSCVGDVLIPASVTVKPGLSITTYAGGASAGNIGPQPGSSGVILLSTSYTLVAAGALVASLQHPSALTSAVNLTARAGGDVHVQSFSPVNFVATSRAGDSATSGFSLSADGNITFAAGAQVQSTGSAAKVVLSTTRGGTITQVAAGTTIVSPRVILSPDLTGATSFIGSAITPIGMNSGVGGTPVALTVQAGSAAYISGNAVGTVSGALTLTGASAVTAAKGVFKLSTTGNIVLAAGATVSTPGTMSISAGGAGSSITQIDSSAAKTTLFSPTIVLSAGTGTGANIGAPGNGNSLAVAADATSPAQAVNLTVNSGDNVFISASNPGSIVSSNMIGASSSNNSFTLSASGNVNLASAARIKSAAGTLSLQAGAGSSITQAAAGMTLMGAAVTLRADVGGTSGSIGSPGCAIGIGSSATTPVSVSPPVILQAVAGKDVYLSVGATATSSGAATIASGLAGTAGGNFSLTTSGNITLANGAYIVGGNSVSLTAGGNSSIAQADASDTTTIFSPTITLTAGSGTAAIGSGPNLLGVAATRGNVSQTVTLTANAAAGSVYVKGVDSLYPANMVNVNLSRSSSAGPGAGIFSLSATGSILVLDGAKVTDSTGSIALTAGAGQSITQAATGVTLSAAFVSLSADAIGLAGALGTSTTSLTVNAAKLSATAGGNMWLNNTAAMTTFTAVSNNGDVNVKGSSGVTFSGLSRSPTGFSLTANGLVSFAANAGVSGGASVNLLTTGGLTQTDAQIVNTIFAPSVTLTTGVSGIGTSGHAVGIASQKGGAAVSLAVTTTGAVFISGNFPTSGGNSSAAAGFNFTGASVSTGAFNMTCAGNIRFPTGGSLKSPATSLATSAGGTSPGDIGQQTLTEAALLGPSVKVSAAGALLVNLQNPSSATATVTLTAIAGGDATIQSFSSATFASISSAGAGATHGFQLSAAGNVSFSPGAQVRSTNGPTKVALSATGTISQAAAGASIVSPTVDLTSAAGIGTSAVPIGTSATDLYANCSTCSAYLMDTANASVHAFTVGPTSTYSVVMSGSNLNIVLANNLNAGSSGTISLANPTGGSIVNPGAAFTLTAKTINLTGSGGVGAAGAPVLVSGCAAPSAVSSAGNVYLSSNTAIGSIAGISAAPGKIVSLTTTGSNQDITVSSNWSNTGGTVIFNSSGAILASGAFTVAAGTVDLTAPNGIGTTTIRVGTRAANLTSHSSSGSIYLQNAASVNLGSSATVPGGTFSLLMSGAALNIALAGNISAGTILLANPGGSITDTAGVTLTASTVTLAGGTGIGAAGAPVLVSGCSAPSATSSAGSVYLSTNTAVSSMSGISAGPAKTLSFTTTGSHLDITLGSNYSNAGGALLLNASGSILNPGSYVLTAGSISLTGNYGVGAGGAIVFTTTANLAANSSSGSVYLQDNATVNLGNSSAGAGGIFSLMMSGTRLNVAVTGSVNASPTGAVYIQNGTGGAITGTTAGIITGATIALTGNAGIGAAGAPVLISGCAVPSVVSSAGSVYLSTDTSISSLAGISALAGKILSLTTTGNGRNITINSNYSNAGGTIIISASGSVLNAGAYTLTAGIINLSGATGVGTSGLPVLTNTSNLTGNIPNLAGNSSSGSVYLQDTSNVILGSSSAGSGGTFRLAMSGTNLSMALGGNVNAGATGTVDLENPTGGSITNTAARTLTGASIILAASAGLGTAAAPMLLSGCSAPHASSSAGSVYLSSNTGINSTAGLSAAPGATLSLTTTGLNVNITIDANYTNAGGTILLNATGSILDPASRTLSAGTINLTGTNGIGAENLPVNIGGIAQPNARSSAGSVYLSSNTAITSFANVTAAAGKIVSIATTGSGLDITLGSSYQNVGGTIYLNASGSILNPRSYTLTAYAIDLTGRNGIGSNSTPSIYVNTANLAANSFAGSVYVQDAVGVKLFPSSAGTGQTFNLSLSGAGNIVLAGNVNASASGRVNLRSYGVITNSGAWVLTGSTITLTGSSGIGAAGAPVLISGCATPSAVSTVGSVYLSSDVALSLSSGISPGAGKTLSLTTTGTGNNINITAKYYNPSGAIILNASGEILAPAHSQYTLTAGTITLSAVNGIGSVSGTPDIGISGCARPTAVSSAGSVYLTSDTAITSLANISAAAGKTVSVTTTGSKRDITIDANYGNAGGKIYLDASGSIFSTGAYTLTASTVDLTARVSLGSSDHPLLAQSSTPGVDLNLFLTSGDPVTHVGGTGIFNVGIPSAGTTSTTSLPATDAEALTQIDAVLNNDWNAWTSSTGRMLTVSEVGKLLANPNITGSQAAVLGLISSMYYVSDKADEQGQPLSFSSVQEELHGAYPLGYYRQAMSQLSSSHKADGSFSLYGSYNGPEMSGIQQGPVGDCFFLAAINGVLNQNPTNIARMITQSGNTFYITFADGTHKTVTLTDGEIASFSYAKNNGCWLATLGMGEAQTVLGGPRAADYSAVEKATPLGPVVDGGFPSQTFGMLTGRPYSSLTSYDYQDNESALSDTYDLSDVDALLSYNISHNYPTGISAPGHALTVLAYDGYDVTILNPWGTSGTYNTGLSQTDYQMTNGQFTIPAYEMMNGFSSITVSTSAFYYAYDYAPAPKAGLPAVTAASSVMGAAGTAMLPSVGTLSFPTQAILSNLSNPPRSIAPVAAMANPANLPQGAMPIQPSSVAGLSAPPLTGVVAAMLPSSPAFCAPLVPTDTSAPLQDLGRAYAMRPCKGTDVTERGTSSEAVSSPAASSSRIQDRNVYVRDLSGVMLFDQTGLHSVQPATRSHAPVGNRSDYRHVSHLTGPDQNSAQIVNPETAYAPLSRSVVLREGRVLFAPDRNVCVETPYAQVKIAANAIALVLVTDKGVAVYNLHDSHSGDVSISSAQCSQPVNLGRHVMISSGLAPYEEVDPARCIAHADMETSTLPGGAGLFRSSFSLASAMCALQPVLTTEHSAAGGRKIAKQLIKNTAVLMQTRIASAPYRRSDDMR